MGPQTTAAVALVGTLSLLLSALPQVSSTGVFELQIRSLRNDLGLTASGSCCQGYRHNGICTAPCRTFFRLCLAHYQADIGSNPRPRCTFANFTSPVLGGNSMNFSALSELPLQASRQNTFYFPVTEFTWPGDFSLIIEVLHDTSSDSSKQQGTDQNPVLIARLAELRTAVSGRDWDVQEHNFNHTLLTYAFRFVCDNHYFGANCAEFCRARDDKFGHYSCSSNGTKVCLDGWDGEYCDMAMCLPGCHPKNGYCDLPNECNCVVGWQGKFCNECTPYPGCQRGYCHSSWECKCEEGWGGLFCNQDLNFCTHYKPCKNGALCTNTGQGGYTCSCLSGYSGVNCERQLDDCQNKTCFNQGICQDMGDGFQCQCPSGFYGRQCEKAAQSCRARPCQNGASCQERGDSYSCRCVAGYTGFNCDQEVNECQSSPCLNEGRCIDQVNGYRCVCPLGYSGGQCEVNDDDCHQRPCLNHGQCLDLVNDFRCQCVPGFVGSLCQVNVDDCEMRPCANGGRCTDLVNDFRCDCAPGFEGKDCSVQIDECKSNPCLHAGICTDLLADYSCSCPEGFWGRNCQLYEGMTWAAPAPGSSFSSSSSSGGLGLNKLTTTTAANDDRVGQVASNVQEDQEDREPRLSVTELLVIVCVGGGIPLVLIIICVTGLLLRRRSCLLHYLPSQQNQANAAREKQQQQHRYINNMNNRSGRSSCSPSSSVDIFTTLPLSASNSSSIKISNEEQEDVNRLKSKQQLLMQLQESPCGGGGADLLLHKVPLSASKQLLHLVLSHQELASPTSSSLSPSTPTAACSLFCKADSLDNECDLDYEKSLSGLDVEFLQAGARKSHREYNKRYFREQVAESSKKTDAHRSSHSSRNSWSSDLHQPTPVRPAQRQGSRDSPASSDYVCTIYRATSPTVSVAPVARPLTPHQTQHFVHPQFERLSHLDEEFLATEV